MIRKVPNKKKDEKYEISNKYENKNNDKTYFRAVCIVLFSLALQGVQKTA
jgi:hypothetical protein